jgi:hypothetical protein
MTILVIEAITKVVIYKTENCQTQNIIFWLKYIWHRYFIFLFVEKKNSLYLAWRLSAETEACSCRLYRNV